MQITFSENLDFVFWKDGNIIGGEPIDSTNKEYWINEYCINQEF